LALADPDQDQVRFAEIGKRLPSIGQSGLGGRSGGDSNIEEFTEHGWLTVNPGPAHYPY
jgi:hypothetical protein